MDSNDETRSSFDDLKLYKYENFPEGQASKRIRLLKLLPRAETDYMIRYTLTQHVLIDESCPPFEALSYVWGPPKDLQLVLCDDQAILVTPNLASALLSLRQNTPRYLWVDQICIQQDHALEKNSQIPLMRDIYSRAFRTIAWLGSENSTMDTAFEFLRRMSRAWNHYVSNTLHRALNESDTAEEPPQSLEAQWGTKAPTSPQVDAVKLMLYNPWFTRVWIIQEATVSKDVVMYSGSSTISFDEMLAGIITMGEFLATTRRNDITVEGNKMLGILAKIRNKLHNSSDGISIVQLIADCHLFRATDDRDRFFALYGISSISTELPHVQADYTLPAPQALSQAMVNLMRHEKSLRLLELSDSSSHADLPSWCPRARITSDPQRFPQSTLYNNDEWAVNAFTASIRRLYGDGIEEEFAEFDWQAFEDAMSKTNEAEAEIRSPRRDLPQTAHFSEVELLDDMRLVVKGQLVDRIKEMSPVVLLPAGIENGYGAFPQESRYLQDIENAMDTDADVSWWDVVGAVGSGISIMSKFATTTMKHWQKHIDALTQMDAMVMSKDGTTQYSSKAHTLEVYRDVLMAGRHGGDSVAKTNNMSESDIVSLFDEWRKNMSTSVKIDVAKKKFGLKGSAGIFSMLSTSFRAHASFKVQMRFLLSHYMSPIYGRRMAWTIGGRLALIPAQTQNMDHILYLQGSEMPFIMRLEGMTWKMIGPAYVDGMMNGELYDADCLADIVIR